MNINMTATLTLYVYKAALARHSMSMRICMTSPSLSSPPPPFHSPDLLFRLILIVTTSRY